MLYRVSEKQMGVLSASYQKRLSLQYGSTTVLAQAVCKWVEDLGLQGQHTDETWLGRTIFTVDASTFFPSVHWFKVGNINKQDTS